MRIRILLALLLLLAPAAFAARPAVWPVDSLVKVFPDDAAGKNRTAAQPWLLARNGHASVQFAVRSAETIEALDVRVKLGHGLQNEVRWVGYVPVRHNPPKSPADEVVRAAPGKFPDPLFDQFPMRLEANQTTPVWITVYAPAGTRPHVYKGKVEFYAGQKRVASVPFRVRVTEATVPTRQTLKVTNWFNFDAEALNHYYDIGRGQDERYWQLLGNMAGVIAAYRQNVIITPVFGLTDAGVNGDALTYDFSRLDRFIETFRQAGAAEVIEGGHLLGRQSGYDSPLIVPGFVIENGQAKRAKLAPDDPRAEAYLKSFLPALHAHLKEKGWLGSYVQHVLDEPHGTEPPYYRKYAKIAHEQLPGVHTIDALDQAANTVGEAADIWVPQLGKFDDSLPAIAQHVKLGGQAWYYTCLFPQSRHLNRFIDYPLLKTRLLLWFDFRYDFTGFLHWGGNYWDGDPFQFVETVIENGTQALPAGDAFITYPSRARNTLLASIRLEAMREGIEDYELLHALAAKNPEKARQLAREAIPGLIDYVRDVAKFRQLQAQLLTAK